MSWELAAVEIVRKMSFATMAEFVVSIFWSWTHHNPWKCTVRKNFNSNFWAVFVFSTKVLSITDKNQSWKWGLTSIWLRFILAWITKKAKISLFLMTVHRVWGAVKSRNLTLLGQKTKAPSAKENTFQDVLATCGILIQIRLKESWMSFHNPGRRGGT